MERRVCGTITVVLEDPFSRHLDYCSLANAISAAVGTFKKARGAGDFLGFEF
jgi:hypothetical protein